MAVGSPATLKSTCHETLLTKIGGNDVLKQVAERWYDKLKHDERLIAFLADQDTIHLRARLSAYLANLFGQKPDPIAAALHKQATSHALQQQRSSALGLQHQPTSSGLVLHPSHPSYHAPSHAPSHALSHAHLQPSRSLHHQATSSRHTGGGAGRCHHLRRVHMRLIQQMGFGPADFDAGMAHFRASLQELGVPEWLVDEVMPKLEELKPFIFDDPDAPPPEEQQEDTEMPERPAARIGSSTGLLGVTLAPMQAAPAPLSSLDVRPVLLQRLRAGVVPVLLPLLLPLLLRGLGRSQGLQPAFEVTSLPPLPAAATAASAPAAATPGTSFKATAKAARLGGSGSENGRAGAGDGKGQSGASVRRTHASDNTTSPARSPVPVPLGSIPCLRTRPPPELQWPVMHMRCAADGVVQVTDELDEHGALHRTLLHRPLRGVNSSHLAWWFGAALPSTLYYRGRAWDAYKLWHPDPRPPQSPTEAPRTGPSDIADGRVPAIHIVERFRTPAFNVSSGSSSNTTGFNDDRTTDSGKDGSSSNSSSSNGPPLPPEYPLDMTLVLNDTQSNMHRLLYYMGPTVMQELAHTWEDSPEGLLITSRFILGGRNPSAAVFNEAARAAAFPPSRLEAWLAHCVEEFGNLPYFLPDVYDTQEAMVSLKAG
ncbi:hypothetical protein HYH02_003495 [Chlamydomonas schloesseri]|uniref:DAPG hydrolase PhiG domain-containing protein n=1 Tax=Chlamydomonas schloesseri TaxID=2026947 RepID=A0A836B9V6_9CHLO|nr:hypothetical protein HYH02_003495 [Chlamydomonas schloesseri]|eukprot:KAG2451715.1 hypothetical protein HYH02_003495 [Chlamydomonas schloesseri]